MYGGGKTTQCQAFEMILNTLITRAPIAYLDGNLSCYAKYSLLGNELHSKREKARSCPTRMRLDDDSSSSRRMWRIDTRNHGSWADGGPRKILPHCHVRRYIQRHIGDVDEDLSVWPFRWSVGRYRGISGQHRVLWPCRKPSRRTLTPGSRSEGRCRCSDLQKASMYRASNFLACPGSISGVCSWVSGSPTKYRHPGGTWMKSFSRPGFHWIIARSFDWIYQYVESTGLWYQSQAIAGLTPWADSIPEYAIQRPTWQCAPRGTVPV